MPTTPVDVLTTVTRLLDRNNRRTTASFTNNGTDTIFVSEDEGSVLTRGYPIVAGGALDLIRVFGDNPHDQWFGVVATTISEMRVLEQFGQLPVLEAPRALG